MLIKYKAVNKITQKKINIIFQMSLFYFMTVNVEALKSHTAVLFAEKKSINHIFINDCILEIQKSPENSRVKKLETV
jgi:hypothetical protein